MFNQLHLALLKRLNTIYDGSIHQDYGIEFSKPNTSNVNKHSLRYFNGKVYSGSALFNSLYSLGGLYDYGWHSGFLYNGQTSNEDFASNCTLLFGFIPMFWSTDYAYNPNGFPGTKLTDDIGGWGPDLPIDAVGTFMSQANIPGQISTINANYWQTADGAKDGIAATGAGKYTALRSTEQINKLSLSNAIGVGSNISSPNNYKSCTFKKSSIEVLKNRVDKGIYWNESEKSQPWLDDNYSSYFRVGIIPVKTEDSHHQTIITSEPIYGYYKYKNENLTQGVSAGTSDHDNYRVVTTNDANIANSDVAWNTYLNGVGHTYVSNDDYFGCMKTENGVGMWANDILDAILARETVVGEGASKASTFAGDLRLKFNLYNYSTIPYITNISCNSAFTHNLPGYRVMQMVPVFASSLNHLFGIDTRKTYSGYCCLIHTFQSIVYNTYRTNVINYSDGDFTPQDIESTSTFGNLTKQRQLKNMSSKYANFVMKYESVDGTYSGGRIYLSFALKVQSNGTGTPLGVKEGPCYATISDWIAWINGNIYVIPNDLFYKYVYYTQSDLTLLDSFTF